MPISDWPAAERPREKLLRGGVATLSDAELLAVFLRVGMAGKSAVDLGRDLLQSFGSLTRLLSAGPADLARVKGVGAAKFAQLQAAMELTRRALAEQLATPQELASPAAVRDFLRLWLSGRPHEVFACLYLDARNRLLGCEELFRGTLTHTSVYPREVVKQALAYNAASVIVAHNHPSGHALPSEADLQMTKTLGRALALVDISLLDHFIVGGDSAYSLAENREM